MAELIDLGDGRWRLEGDVTFDTVPALAAAGRRMIQPHRDIWLDLASLGQTGSVALALFLDWQAAAERVEARLHLQHCPLALQRIAGLSHIVELLNFSS